MRQPSTSPSRKQGAEQGFRAAHVPTGPRWARCVGGGAAISGEIVPAAKINARVHRFVAIKAGREFAEGAQGWRRGSLRPPDRRSGVARSGADVDADHARHREPIKERGRCGTNSNEQTDA